MDAATFASAMRDTGFVDQGRTRRGGRQWSLEWNRHLTFDVHEFDEGIVFTWSFNLGEYFLERGMQIGAGETTFQELYPRSDVKLARDEQAVRAEISRTLGLLRLDLGDLDL